MTIMHKFFLMLALAIVSSNVAAEWTSVGKNNSFTGYVDFISIEKNGNRVRIWSINDYKMPGFLTSGEKYLSTKTQVEYDCKVETKRTLSFVLYSEHMGNGERVSMGHSRPANDDSGSGRHKLNLPGSIDKILWDLACGQRQH